MMPEKVVPGPVSEERCIREAVCIHTKKIFDSCKDKDCIEDLRVYPTRGCQEVIDRAVSVKAGNAELLYAYIDVEPVSFNRGFYTVDVRYFYRITADAFVGAARPVEVTGLAVFDKRVILFGSEGSAKVFSSQGGQRGPGSPGPSRPEQPNRGGGVGGPHHPEHEAGGCVRVPAPGLLLRDPPRHLRLLPRGAGAGGRCPPPVCHPGAVLHHPHGAGYPAAHPRLRLLPAG